jgi:hypothetical protein
VCSPSGLVSLLITGLDFSGFERPSFPVLAWELDSAKIFPAARFFFFGRFWFSSARHLFTTGTQFCFAPSIWQLVPASAEFVLCKIPRQSSCSRFSFFAADLCCLHFLAWVQCVASSSAKESPCDFAFGPVYSPAVSFVKSSADLSFLCSFCAPRSTRPMLWPANKERLSASLPD